MDGVSNDTRSAETRSAETRSAETRGVEAGPSDQERASLAGSVEAKSNADATAVADSITGGAEDQFEKSEVDAAAQTGVVGQPGERPELASLADRIANFQPAPGDPNLDANQTALRREITDRYTVVGDVNGAAAMHSSLSDIVESPNMPQSQRQELRDYMANYTKTDPAVMGAMRGMAAGAVLARGVQRSNGVEPVQSGPPRFTERVDASGRPNGLREMRVGDNTFVVNGGHAFNRVHGPGQRAPSQTGLSQDQIETGLVNSLDRALRSGGTPIPMSPSKLNFVTSIEGQRFGFATTRLPTGEYRITTYWAQ